MSARCAWLALPALAGCGASRGLPPPRPEAVTPAAGWTGADRTIEIRGQDFFAAVVRKLEGSPFETDERFRAWLGDEELAEVRFVDSTTITARVPRGLRPGRHGLTVEAPDGATGVLDDAYVAFAAVPAALDVTLSAQPAAVSVSGTIDVTVTVANTGQTDALAVTPAIAETGIGATAPLFGPEPPPSDLAGGETTVFTFARAATGVGEIRFEATASAVESLTGDPIVATGALSDPVRVLGCQADVDCDDGAFCNGIESCSAGACIPGPPSCVDDGLACTTTCDEITDACNVVAAGTCAIDGACRAPGEVDPANPCLECDPAASQTTWTSDDTNPCADGLFCNGGESCVAGSCLPSAVDPCTADGLSCTNGCDEGTDTCAIDAAACLIDGACRAPGEVDPANPCLECDPAASQTTWTPDDTNPCADGLFCNGPESCASGACVAGAPPCADDGLACTTTCDEPTGACNAVSAGSCLIEGACHAAGEVRPANGCQECDPAVTQTAWTTDDTNACDDADACTSGDACGGGVCAGAWVCAVNTPPRARLAVTPGAGTPATSFLFDAVASSDLEDPFGALEFRWDWEADGTWDTAFSSVPAASHAFATVPPGGIVRVGVEVRDTGGLSGVATRVIALCDPADEVLVTTLADEANAGATPAAPGGTGLSLREAISYASASAGRQVVSFHPFLSAGTLALASALPVIDQGETLVGRADIAIDGSALTGSARCVTLAGTGQVALGLVVQNCPTGMMVDGTGNEVHDCVAHDNDTGIAVWDRFGHRLAGNEVFANSVEGLSIWGGAVVESNLVHDNAVGIGVGYNTAAGSVVRRNLVWGSAGAGVHVFSNADDVTIVHNTIQGSGADGISFAPSCSGGEVVNNVIASSAGFALDLSSAAMASVDSNDVWASGSGACSGTACATQTNPYATDPRFVDAAAGDLRVLQESPLIDLGINAGVDVNGPAAGLFDGLAPDVGGWEAPPGY
jgi:hypothetical protein